MSSECILFSIIISLHICCESCASLGSLPQPYHISTMSFSEQVLSLDTRLSFYSTQIQNIENYKAYLLFKYSMSSKSLCGFGVSLASMHLARIMVGKVLGRCTYLALTSSDAPGQCAESDV